MSRDTIFRISSMTKPITAVAAMMLVEECKLRLDEPMDRLLPELADRRVLRRPDGPLEDTVPAIRPITLRDVLTFRLGIGLVMAPPGRYPIQKGSDILGVLIARAAGQTLDDFFRERIFQPLGMKDTGFHVPAEKLILSRPAVELII